MATTKKTNKQGKVKKKKQNSRKLQITIQTRLTFISNVHYIQLW